MNKDEDLERLEEYDFSNGVRGKYAARFSKGANAILLDPDVAAYFPDGDSANNALRHLVAAFESQRKQ